MERNYLENPTTQIGALNPTELRGQAFRNLHYNDHSPIIKNTTYYANGKIKTSSMMHSELHLSSAKRNVRYPIGILKGYKEDGRLDSLVNYDKIFIITYEKAEKIVKRLDPNSEIVRAVGNLTRSGFAFWEIASRSTKNGLTLIRINGRTGKIITNVHHLISVE